MKFHVIIYGCQMNYSDSARIKAVLINCGRVYVEDKADADVVILDTCSVRQKSEDKVRGMLKELAQLSTPPKVRLTWCMVWHNLNLKKTRTSKSKKYTMWNFTGDVKWKSPQIVGLTDVEKDKKLKDRVRDRVLWTQEQPQDLLYINHAFDPLYRHMHNEFPQVELFFRINDVWFLPYMVQALWYTIADYDVEIVNEYSTIIPHSANQLFSDNTKTAYVPISTWCSQFCAYCIVPYARGLEKNRPMDEIIAEAKSHITNGVQEIVLLGQIVNKHPDFYQILKSVCEIPGVKWVRYTSPYPTYYDDNIFALHNDMEVLCPHIHMPLQSGSSTVLKKMFRWYTREQSLEFIDSIRALSRPISITTDIIVWFTDETEEDFLESMSMAEYGRFDMIYIGIYSPRPGTYGYRKYEDNIPLHIKKDRHHRLNELLRGISIQNNQKELGTTREILLRDVQQDVMMGYSDNMKQIIVKNPSPWSLSDIYIPWQFVTTQVTETADFKLYGKVI